MRCYIHKPKDLLSEYIKSIWIMDEFVISDDDPVCIPLIPSGCTELIFHFNGKGKYSLDKDNNFLTTNASISGQKLNYQNYYSIGSSGLLAVLLKPESANLLLGIPSNIISKSTFNMSDVLGQSSQELLEQINNEVSVFQKFKSVESFFLKKIKKINKGKDERIIEFVNRVSSFGGSISLDKLSNELNISLRQLERKVTEVVGITPKEFTRIIRFQKSLFIKQKNPRLSLTSLAYESGYFDQSHFIKEFKSISGLSPKNYFEISSAFSDYYSL